MHSKTLIITIMVLVMVALLGWIVYLVMDRNDAVVPIQATYGNEKVVYTLDLSEDREPLMLHCKEFGGTFNECGNPCQPSAELCTTVCALTCEKNGEERGTLTLSPGEKGTVGGIALSFEKVIQDSRCPIDVVCIRAGDVTTRISLSSPNEQKQIDLSSEKEELFGAYTIAIESVSPSPSASTPIFEREYEVMFSIENRN